MTKESTRRQSALKNFIHKLANPLYLDLTPFTGFNEYFSNEFFIVNKEAFPEYFPTKESFTKSITTWFNDHENI